MRHLSSKTKPSSKNPPCKLQDKCTNAPFIIRNLVEVSFNAKRLTVQEGAIPPGRCLGDMKIKELKKKSQLSFDSNPFIHSNLGNNTQPKYLTNTCHNFITPGLDTPTHIPLTKINCPVHPGMEHIRSNSNTQQKHQKIEGSTMKVCCWNLRSFNNLNKSAEINKHPSDLILLQEVWNPKEDLLNSLGDMRITQSRRDNHGGSLIAWKEDFLTLSKLPAQINKDTIIARWTLAGNRTLWCSSVYIPKKDKKAILDLMGQIRTIVPESE